MGEDRSWHQRTSLPPACSCHRPRGRQQPSPPITDGSCVCSEGLVFLEGLVDGDSCRREAVNDLTSTPSVEGAAAAILASSRTKRVDVWEELIVCQSCWSGARVVGRIAGADERLPLLLSPPRRPTASLQLRYPPAHRANTDGRQREGMGLTTVRGGEQRSHDVMEVRREGQSTDLEVVHCPLLQRRHAQPPNTP